MKYIKKFVKLNKNRLFWQVCISCISRPSDTYCSLLEYGGPDGELGAAIRYLSQKYAMVTPEAKAVLNDVGTEELAHLEMVGAMVSQLTQGASVEEMQKAGLDPYYTDHGAGVYPQSAAGIPWSAMTIQSTGNPIVDLYENMAAEAAIAKRQQNNYVVKRLCMAYILRFERNRGNDALGFLVSKSGTFF